MRGTSSIGKRASTLMVGFALSVGAYAPFVSANATDFSALNGRWVLEAIDGKTVRMEKGQIYFEISGDTITGYDGCNRFGGSIGQPASIRKGQIGCPAESVLLPLDLSNLTPQLRRAVVSGDILTLPLTLDKGEARFRRSK